MEITCNSCKSKLNIADEKIPQGQMVRINCPKCKNKITIKSKEKPNDSPQEDPSLSDTYADEGKAHLQFIESQKESSQEYKYSYDDFSDDESLDFFEDNVKLALIMASEGENSAKIGTSVQELGYKVIVAKNTREALGKLRFQHFTIIIIAEGFDGQELKNSPIMNYLNHLSMQTRRKIFLVLISDQFKTMDSMMAYAMSTNIVVNSKDIDKLTPIIKRGITEYEKFYKVFLDTLVEVGKG